MPYYDIIKCKIMNVGMELALNWLQSLIVGLISGLTDVLPVSSQAHQTILLTCFGGTELYPLTRLVLHLAILLTLLILCWGQIGRIRRQLKLARMPKRRRSRPVEMASIMDARIIRTAFWFILAGLLLFRLTDSIRGSLFWLAVGSLVNAAVLYVPRMFQTADKDSRLVTPLESMQMGIGVGAAVLPGISSVGASYSVGILHGVDRGYMIHLTMMMHMIFDLGLVVYDVLDVVALPVLETSRRALHSYGLTALAAVVGTVFGYRCLRAVAERSGLTGFSFYSFGMALFALVLYLMV